MASPICLNNRQKVSSFLGQVVRWHKKGPDYSGPCKFAAVRLARLFDQQALAIRRVLESRERHQHTHGRVTDEQVHTDGETQAKENQSGRDEGACK